MASLISIYNAKTGNLWSMMIMFIGKNKVHIEVNILKRIVEKA